MQFEDGAQANYIEGITKKVQHEANLCKSWSSENSSLKARIELLQMEIQVENKFKILIFTPWN